MSEEYLYKLKNGDECSNVSISWRLKGETYDNQSGVTGERETLATNTNIEGNV
jgi:hypothetical protein